MTVPCAPKTRRKSSSVTPGEVDYPLGMPSGAFGDCTSTAIDTNKLYTLRAGLNYHLGQRTSLDFLTGYQGRTGSSGGSSDYDEFWASVQLIRTF